MEQTPVAAVFGGSRGLGLLIGWELVARGWRVVLLARDADELAAAAAPLRPGTVTPMVCDVRDRAAVDSTVDRIEREVGPLAAVFTVAGTIQVGPAEAMGIEHFADALNTMTWGPIHVALAVLPAMCSRGFGRIGTVTSIGGMVSPPHLLPYATAKFGAVGFSDGLAAALQGTGVTATTVVPGLMRTGSHVAARFTGDPAKEYRWFATAASLPVLSTDAERAARRIVTGVLRGRPMVTLTPLAWLGIRVRGVAPGTTIRVLGLVNRLLPGVPDGAATGGPVSGAATVDGRTAQRRADSRWLRALTRLGERAARRYHEPGPAAADYPASTSS